MTTRTETMIEGSVGLLTAHRLEILNRAASKENEKIWELRVRGVLYLGEPGMVFSYYDGTSDCLVFTNFLPCSQWEKLKRALRSIKRETEYGRYEVKAEEGAERAKIALFWHEENFPQTHSPEERFTIIWTSLMNFLPKTPSSVIISPSLLIKEFNLQDLSA